MNENLELSEHELKLVARLASLDLDEFISQMAKNYKHIEHLATTSIAKTLILSERGLLPESRDEIKLLLVLSFRCAMMAKIVGHIGTDPDLRGTIEHDDAKIDQILAQVRDATGRVNAALDEAIKSDAVQP